MSTTEYLIDQLWQAKLARSWTKRALAMAADIHPNTLNLFGRPGFNPSIETLQKLEQVLIKESAKKLTGVDSAQNNEYSDSGEQVANGGDDLQNLPFYPFPY